METDGYKSKECMIQRSFSDIKISLQTGLPKKRIQVVETRLIRNTSFLYERRTIESPEAAVLLGRKLFESYDKEYLYAVYLTARCEPICVELISIGTLNATIISPKDIMKTALLCCAFGLILFHNHPSGGDVVPSEEDINSTKRMKEAGLLMGIKLFDHIIISDTCYVSLKERRII